MKTSQSKNIKKIYRIAWQVVKRMLLGFTLLFMLFVCLAFITRNSLFQHWAQSQLLALLQKKIMSEISVAKFTLDPFRGISANQILFRDHHGDSLIYIEKASIGLLQSLFSVLTNEVHVSSLVLQKPYINIVHYAEEADNSFKVFIDQLLRKNKSTSDFNFNLRYLTMNNARAAYSHKGLNYQVDLHCKYLSAKMDTLNYTDRIFSIRSLIIDSALGDVKWPFVKVAKVKDVLDSLFCTLTPIIRMDTLKVMRSSIFYNFNRQNTHELSQRVFSPLSFIIEDADLLITNILLGDEYYAFDQLDASGILNKKLNVRTIECTGFMMDNRKLKAGNICLSWGDSKILMPLQMQYSNFNDFSDFLQRVYIYGRVEQSEIYLKDLFHFIPQINEKSLLSQHAYLPITLHAEIAGRMSSLKLPVFRMSFADQLDVVGNVATRNIFMRGRGILNCKVERLATNIPFVQNLLPNYKFPESFRHLGNIEFKGRFDGYLDDFVAYGDFSTNLGKVRTDMRLNLRPGRLQATYSGSMNAEAFNIGKMLGLNALEHFTFDAFVKNGRGLTKESVFAELNASISTIQFKGQTYTDISFDGELNQALLNGKIIAKDPKLKFIFYGKINDQDSLPNFDFNADVDRIDLKALGLTKENVEISGNITANFHGRRLETIIGDGKISNLRIISPFLTKPFELANIKLKQRRSGDKLYTEIYSDVLNFKAGGKYNVKTIPDVFIHWLHKQHPDLLRQWNIVHRPIQEEASVVISGDINIRKDLAKTFNFNYCTDHTEFELEFDSEKSIFNFQTNRSNIYYKNTLIRNFSASVSDNNLAHFLITFDQVKTGNKSACGNGKWSFHLSNNVGDGNLKLFDTLNRQVMLNLNYQINLSEQALIFSLLNKDLYVNAVPWRVHPENQCLISKNAFKFSNFVMSDSLHFIRINDYNDRGIRLQTDGFDISLVNAFIKNKSITFYGKFLTDLIIPNIWDPANIHGYIELFQLYLNKDNVGPMHIHFDIPSLNAPINVKVNNEFHHHQLKALGTFNLPLTTNYTWPRYAFDLDIVVNKLPLSLLQNFITSISATTGETSGKVKLYSAGSRVLMDGKMHIPAASTHINYLGCDFSIVDQEIIFKQNIFDFSNITIFDELKNPIKIFGNLTHKNFVTFFIDLRIQSNKALILNTSKQENIYYYGTGITNFVADFKGPLSATNLNLIATTLKGSKLVLPIRYDQNAEDTKFIRFVQRGEDTAKPLTTAGLITGMDIQADLSFTDDAEVSIIFDELAGDIIRGTGRGNLQLRSKRSGEFRINGHYEIESGQYLFTLLNFVNKPFRIKRGGTITWSGDPLDADINLEATYDNLYASPYLLIQEYLSANPDQSIELDAKRRTLIDLNMMLSGSLLRPEISFSIRFPQLIGELRNYTDTKIRLWENNPDQMNQQVFGLLVFGTFLNTNDPLASTFINNLQSTTINTMSEMLTNQFSLFVSNLLSEAFEDVNFISGVDFNVAYDFGGSTIGQTPVEGQEVVFSLRHRLWNDQWAVTLGGNYKSSSVFGSQNLFNPESVIEWVTPVQGLKLRVYYRGDESIEGLRHRIGAGINYRKEFDNLFDFKRELKSRVQTQGKSHG